MSRLEVWTDDFTTAGCCGVSWNVETQVDAGAECFHAKVCVCVCVFLLCHNDDVAVATMRTGASARAPSAMLNVRGHSSLPGKLWLTGASG